MERPAHARPRARRPRRHSRRACPERSRRDAGATFNWSHPGCELPPRAVLCSPRRCRQLPAWHAGAGSSNLSLARSQVQRNSRKSIADAKSLSSKPAANWVHVEANLTEERTVTGWVLDKGVVRASTPNGDKILFGEAVDSEDQASRRHGRNGAAQDAMRLYYRVCRIFPHLAPGWRSHVPFRRYPLAAGESGRVHAAVCARTRIVSSRRHGTKNT